MIVNKNVQEALQASTMPDVGGWGGSFSPEGPADLGIQPSEIKEEYLREI